MQTNANDSASAYDQILTLLPQLTIDDLARLEGEIRRRIRRDPNGDMARKRAAINSIPDFGLGRADEAQD